MRISVKVRPSSTALFSAVDAILSKAVPRRRTNDELIMLRAHEFTHVAFGCARFRVINFHKANHAGHDIELKFLDRSGGRESA